MPYFSTENWSIQLIEINSDCCIKSTSQAATDATEQSEDKHKDTESNYMESNYAYLHI